VTHKNKKNISKVWENRKMVKLVLHWPWKWQN